MQVNLSSIARELEDSKNEASSRVKQLQDEFEALKATNQENLTNLGNVNAESERLKQELNAANKQHGENSENSNRQIKALESKLSFSESQLEENKKLNSELVSVVKENYLKILL